MALMRHLAGPLVHFGRRYNVAASFLWEPRDLWLGVFWRWRDADDEWGHLAHIYICVVPCLPIHITIERDHVR